jgi:uncharacterized protein (DUF58 family)
MFYPIWILTLGFISLSFLDFFLLQRAMRYVHSRRDAPKVLSLSDNQTLRLHLHNASLLPVKLQIIEELPPEIQMRSFQYRCLLKPGEKKTVEYHIRPISRGIYSFGNTRLWGSSPIGFLKRQKIEGTPLDIPVYPSLIQMKKYQIMTNEKLALFYGMKKWRRTGHSYTFDQIKDYVAGDDIRRINWKASARYSGLKVNHYEDEKSKQVYCVIDKSRNMLMPFHHMSLMDYAVNATLVLSNVALQKGDKAGLVTLSNQLGTAIKAENKPLQLQRILKTLFNEKEHHTETDYPLLYDVMSKLSPSRSLIILFAHFDTPQALDRVIPVLKKLSQTHALMVVFFENEEVRQLSKTKETTENQTLSKPNDIYARVLAETFITDGLKMVQKLRLSGIYTVLTSPENLSINTLNKYLELKSKGVI